MIIVYKPKEFSKLINRSVQTLQRWDKKGILKSHFSPTGRRYYTHDQYLEYLGLKATEGKKIVVYTRVSTNGQKADLKNQTQAVRKFCADSKIQVSEWIEEIGSGLNYKRKKFHQLMNDIELGQVSCLVIAHNGCPNRFSKNDMISGRSTII